MNRMVRKFLRACRLYDAVVDFKELVIGTEAKYLRFYSRFVNKGDLCFDVGANVGRRTRVFLKLGASVVAIEPQPHCAEVLRKKYEGNEKVFIVEKAVGEQQGQAEMMICDSHSLSSLSEDWISSVKTSGRYSDCSWAKRVTVPVTTLDDLISEYGKPSFIKMDVEGFEYQALRGLTNPAKLVSFEFTPEFGEVAAKSVEYLSRLGEADFNYARVDKFTELVLPEWVNAEQMSDILASLADKGLIADIYVRFERV